MFYCEEYPISRLLEMNKMLVDSLNDQYTPMTKDEYVRHIQQHPEFINKLPPELKKFALQHANE